MSRALTLPAQKFRAPKEHGQILAVPPLEQAAALLASNRHILASIHISTLSKSLDELRGLARREILAASTAYHHAAGETVPDAVSDTWIVAGHQPELFHPGVWFKNFALHKLARQHGATALNLVVDTDTAKPALMHAPAGGRLARIAFDRSTMEMPYEERMVEEEATFAALPENMEPIIAGWNFEPMLASFWREVMAQAKRTPLLGERFAAARRTVERRWGCVQREVPMSAVCQTEAFAWFVVSILGDLPTFHAAYNRTVQDYRREHGIRSRGHPVPDLAVDGDWRETPFWAWRRGERRRGKLFVRSMPDFWALRVGSSEWPSIPRKNPIDAWRSLEINGFKVRSRALTTTMFARIYLADLFIHGIGGGIYDELTDRLIESIYGIPAPGFLVLSATLLLPLPRFPDAAAQGRILERRLRDLIYKPERFLEGQTETEPFVREKQEWIRRACATHAERVERFERIRAINGRLGPFVLAQRETLQVDHRERRRQVEWNEIASRRDYAFCLYPEEMLRAFFT